MLTGIVSTADVTPPATSPFQFSSQPPFMRSLPLALRAPQPFGVRRFVGCAGASLLVRNICGGPPSPPPRASAHPKVDGHRHRRPDVTIGAARGQESADAWREPGTDQSEGTSIG